MKCWFSICVCLLAFEASAARGQDFLDRVDETLTISTLQDQLRLRFSGTVDLEGYFFGQPAPALINSEGDALFNPRMTLFLDAQWQSQLYLFVQTRLDRGFDPADHVAELRLDEYAFRYTPWEDGRISLQIGKFATVVGTYAQRHLSWDNPFVSAPLLYENVTAVSDKSAPQSAGQFLHRFSPGEKYEFNPIIWGPSYASGLSIAGRLDKFEYAVEMKNAPLSSRPESWSLTEVGFQYPTVSARLGFRPNPMWNFGVSASDGAYFREEAGMKLPAGRNLGDYHERVLGQDITFAWHHLQIWAECMRLSLTCPVWATRQRSPIMLRRSTSSRLSCSARCAGTSNYSAPCGTARAVILNGELIYPVLMSLLVTALRPTLS